MYGVVKRFKYGEVPSSEINSETHKKAHRMLAYCRQELGLDSVRIRWFCPVNFKQADYKFLSTFDSDTEISGCVFGKAPNEIWIKAFEWWADTCKTIAHECLHVMQLKGIVNYDLEPLAREFATEAMQTIDWYDDNLLFEHLAERGRFKSKESSQTSAKPAYTPSKRVQESLESMQPVLVAAQAYYKVVKHQESIREAKACHMLCLAPGARNNCGCSRGARCNDSVTLGSVRDDARNKIKSAYRESMQRMAIKMNAAGVR